MALCTTAAGRFRCMTSPYLSDETSAKAVIGVSRR